VDRSDFMWKYRVSWDSSHLDVPSIGDFHEFSVSLVVCCNVKCYVG